MSRDGDRRTDSGTPRKLWVDESRESERRPREIKRREDGERKRDELRFQETETREQAERKLWVDDKKDSLKKDRTKTLWNGDMEGRKRERTNTKEEKDWDILLFNMFPTNAHKRPPPIKLFDSKLKIIDVNPKNLSENTGSFVIGVLGRKGVGKSGITSSLLSMKKPKGTGIGVDLHVLPEGLMVIEAPPILNEQDNIQHTKMALFLLSVCHIIVLVADKHDLELLNYIKRVDELKSAIDQRDSKKDNLFSNTQYRPHLVYVLNKQEASLNLYNSVKTDFHQILDHSNMVIKNSLPKQSLIITLEQDETYDFNQEQILFHNVESSSNISDIPLEETKEEEINDLPNIILLPDKNDEGWVCERFETALQNFTNQLKGFPRMTTFGGKTSFSTSEKEWFAIAKAANEKINLFEMTWPKAFEFDYQI
ncbi:smg-9, nonsense mediated mRNA decay factor [Boothiomyces macroporosus]|uniref:Smg-9, nonsense mediated mRNA decay factor n=1 Tax=Boothiomyces macroporosus TaxID=261099 RepID=A0AAD5UCI2_9FUNG|nr:smg-9, nonsense mediated mRNA decay factor [Boothiomyces macroporosus]